VKNSLPSHIIVVLDALDECEQLDSVSRIIKLLTTELKAKTRPLKFFVTSRPESHLRSLFSSRQVKIQTRAFALHDIIVSEVQQDIRLFVENELDQIADDHCEVLDGDPWPETKVIESLVEMASGLFIVAATALKFIRPDKPSVILGIVWQ
jgi:hypothetical protein